MQNQVISAMEEFKYCSDSSLEMNGKDNLDCSNDFQGIMAMEGFEDEDITNTEETNCSSSINNNGKKKRLTTDQVQALEKIFEVDSKLDQERKIKLAQELGLQPRQVAIWFQNRRARWKTKQLERDFRLLKANYESLQLNYSQIEREKEGLVAELRGLKEKLGEENSVEKASTTTENQEVYNNYYSNCNPSSSSSFIIINKQTKDFKERLSSDDSDSSTGLILNEDSYFNTHPMTSRLSDHGLIVADQSSAAFSSSTSVYPHPHPPPPPSSSLMDSSIGGAMMMRAYQQQALSMEEQQNFLTGDDESCNMMMPLPTDQIPFFWYISDKRN